MPESYVTISEIREQPNAIETVLKDLREKEEELFDVCSNSSSFCLTGCGSSYYLALTGNALLNKNDLSFAFPSSEIFISSDQIPSIPFDVILPISRSGETTETVKATKFLKEKVPKIKAVGITCTKESSIYELSNIPILSRNGGEESVVMTKSFSSMLVAIEYFSKLNSGKHSPSKDFRKLPRDSKRVLEKSEDLAKEIESNKNLKKFVFLGTGKYYGLASEAMLKTEEMALSWSKAYHPLEFRHGPKSIIDDNTLVTLFCPTWKDEEHEELLEEIRLLGAKTLVVGRKKDVGKMESDYTLKIPSRKENTELSLYIPIVQFLGYYLAINLGLNPDNPKNLTQVVKI